MRRLAIFGGLFAFWLVLSGHYDLLHLGAGLLSSGLVTWLSLEVLRLDTSPRTGASVWRLIRYIPWIFGQVVVASLHVVHLVLRPSGIRPQIVRFRTGLRSDLAKTLLGNSITLTPGTVTMDIVGDEFIVHALSDHAARELRGGAMERRVARIFNDEPGDAGARSAG